MHVKIVSQLPCNFNLPKRKITGCGGPSNGNSSRSLEIPLDNTLQSNVVQKKKIISDTLELTNIYNNIEKLGEVFFFPPLYNTHHK